MWQDGEFWVNLFGVFLPCSHNVLIWHQPPRLRNFRGLLLRKQNTFSIIAPLVWASLQGKVLIFSLPVSFSHSALCFSSLQLYFPFCIPWPECSLAHSLLPFALRVPCPPPTARSLFHGWRPSRKMVTRMQFDYSSQNDTGSSPANQSISPFHVEAAATEPSAVFRAGSEEKIMLRKHL